MKKQSKTFLKSLFSRRSAVDGVAVDVVAVGGVAVDVVAISGVASVASSSMASTLIALLSMA